MKLRFTQLTLAFLFLTAVSIFAQQNGGRYNNFKFDKLTVEDGLSSGVIYSFCQDEEGYLWIGTGEGLNRYDGYDFKVLKHKPFDHNSLSDNWVLSITPDSNGILWIGTHNGGLTKYNKENNQFTTYQFSADNNNSINSDRVWDVAIADSGSLWIATSGGLALFDPVQENFRRFTHKLTDSSTISSNSVNQVFIDSQKNIWVATFGGGLNKIIRKNNDYFFEHILPEDDLFSGLMIKVVQEDKFGRLWLGTYRNGLFCFDPYSGKYIQLKNDPEKPNSLLQNSIFAIEFDSEGNLWAGTHDYGISILTAGKVDHLSGGDEKFVNVKNNPRIPESLSNNSAIAIYKDFNNLMWIGTDNGVNKYNPFRSRFFTLPVTVDSTENPDGSFIKSLAQNSVGEVFIGTYNNGLFRYNENTGNLSKYIADRDNENTLSNNTVWAVVEEKPGEYWVATSYGLNYFQDSLNTWTHFHKSASSTSLSHDNISALFNYNDRYLFIGTWGGGVNILDKRTGQFFRHMHDYQDSTSLTSNVIKSFFLDSDKNLWISTFGGGLNYISGKDLENQIPAELKLKNFRHDPANKSGLSTDNLTYLTQTSDGILWCGTFGGGLNKLSPVKNSEGEITGLNIISYMESDGLPDNTIYNLLVDASGNLWMSTNKGLSKFDRDSEVFFNYDKRDGLLDNEFDQGACADQFGRLIFGSISGLNIFHPEDLNTSDKVAPVVFTSVKKFGPGMDSETDLVLGDDIVIEHSDYYFAIDFAALDLTRPEKNQYAYMLEGYDKDWIYLGNNRSVRYTNLRGGEYTFKVRATNSDGIWMEEYASLSLTVTSPFWMSWWAVGIYIIAFAGFLYVIIYFSGREQRRELSLRKKELDFEKNVSRKLKEEEKLKEALFRISNAVSESSQLDQLCIRVHQIIKEHVHAENLFIAIYNPHTDLIEYPYYIDTNEKLSKNSIPAAKFEKSLTRYIISTGKPLLIKDFEFRNLVKEGVVDLIGQPSKEWLGIPLKNNNGDITGVLAVQNYGNDYIYTENDKNILSFVSGQIGIAIERMQNEELKKRYDFIVNTSHLYMSMIDKDYRYVAVNNEFCKYLDLGRDQIIGRTVSEVWGIHEYSNSLKEKLERVFSGEELRFTSEYNLDDEGAKRFEIEFYPYFSDTGDVTHAAIILRDVTELIKAEENVNRITRAIKHAREIIFITEIDGTINYVNPAFERCYGYKAGEVTGKNPRILKSNKTPDTIHKKLWESAIDGKFFRCELTNLTKEREEVEIALSVSPFTGAEGHIIGYLCIQYDITGYKTNDTELNSARVYAEETAGLFRELINVINDGTDKPFSELNSLVAAIKEQNTLYTDEEIKSFTDPVVNSARRVKNVIVQARDIANLQQGEYKPVTQSFDVCALLRKVYDYNIKSGLHESVDYLLHNNLPECIIKNDIYAVEQIFAGLISHAVKNTVEGTLKAELSEENSNTITFTVKYSGSDQNGEKLRELFNNTVTYENIKSGDIELVLVKRFCKEINAEVNIITSNGNGSGVTIKIPR